MRITSALLLLCGLMLPVCVNAQLSWSKNTYNATGFHILRGDFNNDGYPDLFVYEGNMVSVLLNKGDGSFVNVQTLNFTMTDATLVDFNRDGKLDVVGCSDTLVEILQGNGDGTLKINHPVQVPCTWIASADFNLDRNPDLAVGHPSGIGRGPNTVMILLGDGRGNFLGDVEYDDVDFISSEGNACVLNGKAIAADFTRDKIPDLFITADCPNDVVSFSSVIVGVNDGTGHLTFHRDVETTFNADMQLRLTEANNDRSNDVVAVGQGNGPHGAGSSALMLFVSHGDGTFEVQPAITESEGTGDNNIIRAGAYVDFDGDGIRDVLGMIDSFSLEGNETLSMQFFKGQIDGTYKLTQTSPLASQVFDMVWGDFNKMGRADIAMVRSSSTDVWINKTSSAPPCGDNFRPRILGTCIFTATPGIFRFFSSPFDFMPINAIQIYVDGTVKYESPEDFMSTRLAIPDGTHSLTFKVWDNRGAFSATTTLTSCTNTADRTIRICAPLNGSTADRLLRVVAGAATNLKFSAIQIYIDGIVKFTGKDQFVDIDFPGVSPGQHRITVKGWDSGGPFSETIVVAVQ